MTGGPTDTEETPPASHAPVGPTPASRRTFLRVAGRAAVVATGAAAIGGALPDSASAATNYAQLDAPNRYAADQTLGDNFRFTFAARTTDRSASLRFMPTTDTPYPAAPWSIYVFDGNASNHDHVLSFEYNSWAGLQPGSQGRLVQGEHFARMGLESRFVDDSQDPGVNRGQFEWNFDVAPALNDTPGEAVSRPLAMAFIMDSTGTVAGRPTYTTQFTVGDATDWENQAVLNDTVPNLQTNVMILHSRLGVGGNVFPGETLAVRPKFRDDQALVIDHQLGAPADLIVAGAGMGTDGLRPSFRLTKDTIELLGQKDGAAHLYIGDPSAATPQAEVFLAGSGLIYSGWGPAGSPGELRLQPGGGKLDHLYLGSGKEAGRVMVGMPVQFMPGKDLYFASTGGSRIGTAPDQQIGFWGATPVVRPTVTGSRRGNTALRSLLRSLAAAGLIVDRTGA